MHTPWVSFDGKDCSGCKHLNERGYCEFTACIIPCTVSGTIPEVKPRTNADRIRAMTDEELAVQIAWPYLASPPWCSEHTTCPYISEDPTPCDKCALDWLKQEAENGN